MATVNQLVRKPRKRNCQQNTVETSLIPTNLPQNLAPGVVFDVESKSQDKNSKIRAPEAQKWKN